MGYLVFFIYMTIGFQFSIRVFWWGRHIVQDSSDFIIPFLGGLIWPILMLISLFDPDYRKAMYHNCEK